MAGSWTGYDLAEYGSLVDCVSALKWVYNVGSTILCCVVWKSRRPTWLQERAAEGTVSHIHCPSVTVTKEGEILLLHIVMQVCPLS
jgi:hypothetical protein